MSPDTRSPANDAHYLQLALQQAQLAAQAGEVPVGAVVVSPNGQVLGAGYNRTIADHDPSAHAEIQALRAAAQASANHRLEGCTLYVTLEPCAMCSGALLHARLARVVYAVADPKTGAAGSVLDLFAQRALNHQTVCQAFAPQNAQDRALREHCAAILQTFFQQRRMAQTALRQQPAHAALREDALRLPPAHFAQIAPLQALKPWGQFVLLNDPDQPHSPPWRMHVFDTAPHDWQRPAVLLLHGYASYSLLWADLIHQLHAAGWRVLAPDLIGHGQSDKPKKAQRHHLAWHAALLQQWLEQAQWPQHTHRAAVLHDSAISLLPHLPTQSAGALSNTPGGTLAHTTSHTISHAISHTICLPAKQATTWRQQCLARARSGRVGFDLDAHWALTPDEAHRHDWSAPWPDAGHRAALQWPQWAAKHTVDQARGTIAATQAHHAEIMAVPADGAAFRQWLQQHSDDLLHALHAHGPTPSAPARHAPQNQASAQASG